MILETHTTTTTQQTTRRQWDKLTNWQLTWHDTHYKFIFSTISHFQFFFFVKSIYFIQLTSKGNSESKGEIMMTLGEKEREKEEREWWSWRELNRFPTFDRWRWRYIIFALFCSFSFSNFQILIYLMLKHINAIYDWTWFFVFNFTSHKWYIHYYFVLQTTILFYSLFL